MSTIPIRPFRFGVQVSEPIGHRDFVELARKAEDLGYATLTLPDHFDGQLAPVPALQCAADATTDLRVGALVFDNDYKHPIVLAKELATMDVLSDGRLEIGLGAGWMATDYAQSGISYDPPGVRVSRMIEGLAVIKGALAAERFSFTGDHYTITDYDGFPKPIQQPPPVLIGGGGPRVLKFAAQNADIVGINATLTSGAIDAATLATITAAEVDKKQGWVVEAASDVGRLADIEFNVRVFLVNITESTQSALADTAQMLGLPEEEIANSPYALIGPPEKLIDDLERRRDRWGFSYAIIGQRDMERFAPVVASLTAA